MLSHNSASLRTGIVRFVFAVAVLTASFAIFTGTASAHYGHHWSGHQNYSWHGWHTWYWSHGHGHCNRTPVPIASFTADPAATFVDETVSFDASGTSGGVVGDDDDDPVVGVVTNYVWDFGDGAAATSELPTTTHAYSAPGNFTVKLTVTNDANKTSSTTRSVSVAPLPVPTASFTVSDSPLATHSVGFDGSASTGGESAGRVGTIVSYSWDFGDGPVVVPAAENADPTSTHNFAEAGAYDVTLTVVNNAGKSDSQTQSVVVAPLPKPKPTAAFTITPSSPVAERNIDFDGSTSTGGVTEDAVGTIVAYDWDFGDGHATSGVVAATSHTFAVEGTFVVSLTVTNDAGESDVATQSIVVAPAPPPYDPGDGPTSEFDASGATPYTVNPLAPQSLVTSAKSSKGVKVGFSVSFAVPSGSDAASACDGDGAVNVSAAGQRKVTGNASVSTGGAGCQLKFSVRLPKGYSGKKAKFAFAFAGNDTVAPWSLSRKLLVK